MSEQQPQLNESQNDELSEVWYERALLWLAGVLGSVLRTTIAFFNGLPLRIRHFFRTKIIEKRRMPKRTSIHKVYVLVGYTTKEYVDKKCRKERWLLRARHILITVIVFIILIMIIQWFVPQVDTEEYSQMLGVDNVEELTESDPFASGKVTEEVGLESAAVTPVPSQTIDNAPTVSSQEPV